uniref:Uncharacterized protein n=1 Tax=Wuchereria bancrofti TaxID=6293 RepID=A0AAF5RX55_WUCBA
MNLTSNRMMMKKKMRTGKTINNIINSDRMISLDTTIGCLSLLNSIKLIVIIGLLSTLAISILIIMYFRPAILAIIIPITVISTTLYGILRRKHFCLWPIIGISLISYQIILKPCQLYQWFHLILTLYFDLFFIYFFIFKPNYIIMVLNWVFDMTIYLTIKYGQENVSRVPDALIIGLCIDNYQ